MDPLDDISDAQPRWSPDVQSLELLSGRGDKDTIIPNTTRTAPTQQSSKKSGARFRCRTERLFITYSKLSVRLSDLSPRDRVNYLGGRVRAIHDILAVYGKGFYVVEPHKDGTPHVHAYLIAKDLDSGGKIVINKARALDVPKLIKDKEGNELTFHPNFSTCRSIPGSIKYLLKNDNVAKPIAMTDEELEKLLDEGLGTDTKLDRIGRKILDNPSYLDNLLRLEPGVAIRHWNALEKYRNRAKELKYRPILPMDGGIDWKHIMAMFKEASPTLYKIYRNTLFKWCRETLVPPYNPPRKTPQLWLSGPANCGKTHLWSTLHQILKTRTILMGEGKFWDGVSDDCQLLILDEYGITNCKPITVLNAVLEGQTARINIKNATMMREKNRAVAIFSNHTPREIYFQETPEVMEALNSRIRHVQITPETTPCFILSDLLQKQYGLEPQRVYEPYADSESDEEEE